jgi:hypothetical protein
MDTELPQYNLKFIYRRHFVFFNSEPKFRIQCTGMIIIYLYALCHMPSCSDSSDITLKPNTKESFWKAT